MSDKLEVKLSTEKISDEYEHYDNSKASVHVFSDESKSLIRLKKGLNVCGFKPDYYPLDKKDDVLKKLNQISNLKFEDKTCLIIIVLGRTREEFERGCILPNKEKKSDKDNLIFLIDVYEPFITCTSLDDKPKLFFFQAAIEFDPIQTDSSCNKKSKYDVPIEADLFVIYKILEEEESYGYIDALCNNLEKNAKRDHIIDIISNTNCLGNRPLIISTSTRKFYISSNETRGRFYDMANDTEQITTLIKSITKKVANIKCNKTAGELPPVNDRSEKPRSRSAIEGSGLTPLKSRNDPNQKSIKKMPWKP